MISPNSQSRSLAAAAGLALVFAVPGGLLNIPVVAAPQSGDSALSAWPAGEESRTESEFLTSALPVAGNKSDPENAAPGFFRAPAPSAHDPGTILYVGLRAEEAPTGNPFRAPLFSGSIESFNLGVSGAQPAPQTVGDIGEIYPEDAPAVPMAYIVYRLDFTNRGEGVALFATPTLTTEPFTTTSPDELDAKFAWDAIHFSDFALVEDHENDWKIEKSPTRARLAPEPTSAALLGLGLLGLGARRRRR